MCDEDFEDVSLLTPADQIPDNLNPTEKMRKQVEEQTEIPQIKEMPGNIDQYETLPPLKNDFIPEEILWSLTTVPNSCCRGGSPIKSPKDLKSHCVRTTDHIWHHPRWRSKFKYLIDQPTSLAGAGRDISFLCDAVHTKCPVNGMPAALAAMDKSAVRAQFERHPITKQIAVPESLIPDEYHIVKNKGVLGLEYYDDKYTTLLEDHAKKLRVFPSMKPNGRLEAIQLSQVMDIMLEKVGFNDDNKQELKGEVQMHHLLDLVKKEQDIYNIVFHELIRQVSVDCSERGELLAKIRDKYVGLLDYIPRHLTSMHNEIMMQRLLDKQLILELFIFKNAVEKLNSELAELREHDLKATKTLAKTQEELSNALIEAHKNANMLDEYHKLYQLQRKRLISQIGTLTQEKDWWSNAAYSLALKVTEEHNLKLVHDLEVSEKLWTQIAQHFVTVLGTKDAEDQTKLQEITANWRDQMMKFTKNLQDSENSSFEKRKLILSGLQKWHEYLSEKKLKHQGMKTIPRDKLNALMNDLKDWNEMFTQDYERFEGSLFLANQEALLDIVQLQNDWTDLSLSLFNHHRWSYDKTLPEQLTMEKLNNRVTALSHRYSSMLTGENGTAWRLMKLQDMLESCQTKYDCTNLEDKGLIENNLMKLSEIFPVLINQLEEIVKLATTQNEEEIKMNLPVIREQLGEVNQMLQDWLWSLFKMISLKDTKLKQQVAIIQSSMSHLLIDILLYIVHDPAGKVKKVYFKYLPEPNTADRLEEKALMVANQLNILSTQIYSWCRDIVEALMKQKKVDDVDNPDHELKELEQLKTESSEWIDICETLLSGIQERSVQLLSSRSEEIQSHINMTRELCTACLWHSSTNILGMSESELPLLLSGKSEIAEVPATIASFQKLSTTAGTEAGTSVAVVIEDVTDVGKTSQPLMRVESVNDAERTVNVEDKSLGIIDVKNFQSPSKSGIMYIGEDTNIHERDLKETPLHVEKGDFDAVVPVNRKATRNYEAIVEMGVLQKQIIDAEQRALYAEERASSLDASLQEALDKIKELTLELKNKKPLEVTTIPDKSPLPNGTVSARSVVKVAKPSPKPKTIPWD
ncbi:axonemal dynein light chain domain-containing protein 1 isoform X2 [Narcine bancroftii]|uniref:axonemal dynein light chain domain-containing protein 1 isoform X2 n=1 Tax=Narcine bancroftii TaxID=1343680 RepID=UPI0038311C17